MTLRQALSQVPDPRAHNRRYPLWGLLALILVAFLSRVDSLRGVERFARANPHLLPHLGLRKAPGHTAITLLLHRLDPEKLQAALGQVFPEADLGEVLVVDGKHLRGSGKGKSPQVKLVEVLALHLHTTLAQARAEGREEKAFLELLDRLEARELEGKVVVGDAGYLYPEVAARVRKKRGDYLLVLKGNQEELLSWALEVFKGMAGRRLPGETEATWSGVRDGEVWTYRVWASPYLPEEVRAFPGARQVVRLWREVRHKGTGEVRRTVSYALTSLGPEVADAKRLGSLLLSRWEVENRSFWVRDVCFGEDACQVRGVGAWVLAVLRAFLVSMLHREGVREKKAALEIFFFNPLSALRFLGLYAA
ncbi:transposase IS4 family protein [Allomeiothermus silvanus DSM 9946]|uniref:Transposase IS4 family protein n=1 Tax=Allomeiothermus silvanus (strain ATCC 700542 / DSM 9946 / NBRC 106475 / NCIMB 13440 / VI-R2) TaxID=526227 RepID=D7BGM6_ALLS1|nr:transposase IS4 family protein [Allomeiothermus silvanus DSM 9946]ADH63863.1 transposase IS4 family protein [Allomeiothermus silvanus DSM 9946]